jgi:GTP cyclohydrolase III
MSQFIRNDSYVTVVFKHEAATDPSPAHTGLSKILNDVMNTSCADRMSTNHQAVMQILTNDSISTVLHFRTNSSVKMA